jgi:hypothetical protein
LLLPGERIEELGLWVKWKLKSKNRTDSILSKID